MNVFNTENDKGLVRGMGFAHTSDCYVSLSIHRKNHETSEDLCLGRIIT